jgi:hypothetical protein
VGNNKEDRQACGRTVSNRDNKVAAAAFRELAGVDFEQFTRQAPVKLLLALSRFAEPVDLTVLQFADEGSKARFSPIQSVRIARARL